MSVKPTPRGPVVPPIKGPKPSPVQRQVDRFFAMLAFRDTLPEGPEYMRTFATETRMKRRLARLPNIGDADMGAKARVLVASLKRCGQLDIDDEMLLWSLAA